MGVYLSGPLLGAHVYLPNGIDFVSEGPRTMIPGGILPHQKVIVPVTVQFPWHRKDYLIKISLVQEGCAWFYWENPANALEINEQR